MERWVIFKLHEGKEEYYLFRNNNMTQWVTQIKEALKFETLDSTNETCNTLSDVGYKCFTKSFIE